MPEQQSERDVDAEIAQGIGWPYVFVSRNRSGVVLGIPPGGNQMTDEYQAVPHFHTDSRADFDKGGLVDAMWDKGWVVSFRRNTRGERYRARFHQLRDFRLGDGSADTPTRAVAMAASAAMKARETAQKEPRQT